ncbi:UNVERIFIED_CONTAM: glutaredoxin family protein [Halobacillus marinus]|uniref:glutaredoxin family protein n=1 Tax=Halobacillus sp. BAB-2008 TaxID=1246484 RepID=UPI0002A4D1C2|nr:glutaredoxin family protein [Halobacillus sp. BAB-2008]ELK46800.1 glutaredoxin [Halobacillus sp. BAB-2008]
MEVIVFSAKSCGFCHQQSEFLKRNGVEFIEKDVMADKTVFQEFQSLGGTGTPFTIVKRDGAIASKITGFNKDKLVQDLGIEELNG